MTTLYAYLAAALLLLAVGAAVDHHFTAGHYQRAIAADKAAQVQAVADAQAKVIAVQQAREDTERKAETDHENLTAANAAMLDAFTGRVRELESALRGSSLSRPVDHPSQPVPAPAEPGSAPGAAGRDGQSPAVVAAVDGLNGAIGRAFAACQADSAELAAILSLSPNP